MDDSLIFDIINSIENKENILLHGPGGCGKSYCLKYIADYFQKKNKKIACTSTTGVSAINLCDSERKISATTLHSWSGIGIGTLSAKKLIAKIYTKKEARERWLTTEILILDEVSMLGATLIDKIDYIGRHIRQSDLPFGGLQVIFSGDFLQLPPVKDDWAFNSDVWESIKFHPYILTEPKRYDDLDYFNMLLRIRNGLHTLVDEKSIKARIVAYKNFLEIVKNSKENINIIKPTRIYSKKKDVDQENFSELEKLDGDVEEFIAVDNFTKITDKAKPDYYFEALDENIPRSIALKKGAQVMLKFNLDIKQGFVNGTRGVVLDIDAGNQTVLVRFLNGKKLLVEKIVWTNEDKDGIATRTQIPLILAWSVTCHKCQSTTLDYAIIDLGPDIFCDGQAYVALSRVRNFRGLFITNFLSSSLRVNKEALGYSNTLIEHFDEFKKYKEEEK